jgi:hypothetical protein
VSGKKFSAENRTSVNVSKEFRNMLQKVACMYTLKYNKHISLGDLLELTFTSLTDHCDVSEYILHAIISLKKETSSNE